MSSIPAPSPTELLARLVAFDTTSANSNLELTGFVRDYLSSHRIKCHLIPSDCGQKAGVFATIGPEGPGGVALSAHTDCVPVTGQQWSADPFALRLREGLLHGRGACDMKGFAACVLASVPLFLQVELQEPIHIVFSYDEEIGCVGVRPIVEKLGRELPKPRIVIVGEPTEMQVVEAHKAIQSLVTVVTGLEGHSAAPARGVNAIVYASEMVLELHRLAEEKMETERDERFDPPYTTAQAGLIEGGTATNVIPKLCRFKWQVRSLPDADPDDIPRRLEAFAQDRLLPRMREVYAGASIETEQTNAVAGFAAAERSEAVALALSLTGAERAKAVSFTTEAGLFEEVGCQAVVCGPGSIAQAHMADEHISVSQLEGCMAFLARLAERLSR